MHYVSFHLISLIRACRLFRQLQGCFMHSLPDFSFSKCKDLLPFCGHASLLLLFLCSYYPSFRKCSSHNSMYNCHLLILESMAQISLLPRSIHYSAWFLHISSPFFFLFIYFIALVLPIIILFIYFLCV